MSALTAKIPCGTLLRADVVGPVKWSKLPAWSLLQANLSFPLFVGQSIALPANTALRLEVGSSEKIRTSESAWRKTGLAIVRAFSPLQRGHASEYRVRLSTAEVQLPGGAWTPIRASVLRAGSAVVVNPHESASQAAVAPDPGSLKSPQPSAPRKGKFKSVLVLHLENAVPLGAATVAWAPPTAADPTARAFLLTALSASHSREGDKFQAILAEPLPAAERVFDSGSLVEGIVLRRTPPRILHRAGKLYLRIDRVRARNGDALNVSGTLSGAEADSESRFVTDEEGTLRGRKPGVTNALVDLGISYAVGKVSDDIAETPIRAIAASMSDAAVANVARYVGLAGAGTYLVTRHGRDVQLPQYAEIEISFSRTWQSH